MTASAPWNVKETLNSSCFDYCFMLDEKDKAILKELQKDARRSTKAIAKDLDDPPGDRS